MRNIAIIALLALLWQPAPACSESGPLAPVWLTLEEAIRRGIEANLALITAVTRVAEAEGSHERQLSKYLPHAHLEPSFTYQSINLRALGINFAGSPSIVGPFTTWDFRAYADQSIIDLQAYHQIKASDKDKQARVQDFRDVRNQVIREVAGQYLQVQSLVAQAEAAQSRAFTSETLEKLARDQHDAGVATGVDVLRAQVQLANDRQSLLVAQNAVKQSVMTLARTIGLSPGTPLVLAEPLAYRALEAPQIEEAVTDALKQRADYRSLSLQHDSLEEQLKASRSRYYPKLTVSGNYGGNGPTVGDLQQTGLVKVDLQFTIFDLDREGERKELQSRLQRVEAQIADERRAIEQDVRGALLNLESSGDQVKVAQEGLSLAERELQMAEDRFRHGVADNIEVVNAQDALARAQQNRILALTGYADAKIALARALGDTEMTYRSFLAIQ